VVVGNFNTPLSPVDKSSMQKKSTKILELNDTIDLIDLTMIYRVFHHATVQYTFFSAVHVTFYKIDHILGHKASLNKYKKTKITHCILSDHKAIKLDMNKISTRKYTNDWRLKTYC
jgi:exonuclease III